MHRRHRPVRTRTAPLTGHLGCTHRSCLGSGAACSFPLRLTVRGSFRDSSFLCFDTEPHLLRCRQRLGFPGLLCDQPSLRHDFGCGLLLVLLATSARGAFMSDIVSAHLLQASPAARTGGWTCLSSQAGPRATLPLRPCVPEVRFAGKGAHHWRVGEGSRTQTDDGSCAARYPSSLSRAHVAARSSRAYSPGAVAGFSRHRF